MLEQQLCAEDVDPAGLDEAREDALGDATAFSEAAQAPAAVAKTAAYVLGDTTARRFGSPPVGIPDMAGYAVGLRIVDAHLARSEMTVAESTNLTGAEILASATGP